MAAKKTASRKAKGKAAGKDGARKPARRDKGAAAKRTGGRRGGKPAKTRRGGKWRAIRFIISLGIWMTVGLAGALVWFAWDIPNPEETLAETTRRPGITVLANDGSPLTRFGQLYGRKVTLEELPPHLPHALLAVEDRRFYDHPGIDPIGILRAFYVNITEGAIREGGSTLTQQLAKNLFLTRERTIRRKVQEAILALWLESTFTKDRLLEIYLNRVYLGAGAYGVEAAARRYFGKSAAALDLWQSAVLAGLPKAPTALNPFRAPEDAAKRARVVLSSMVNAGWITQAEAKSAARDRVMTVSLDRAGEQSRWFADWALDRATDILGGIDRDIIVETTLEPSLQQAAEAAARTIGPEARAKDAAELGFVAMRPDGAVVAMLGGYDRSKSAFNRAVLARRQPGSTFKLFVYLAGLEAGLTPDDTIDDRSITVQGWTPRNASRGHRGAVTLREGVARSINTIAVAVSEKTGRNAVIEMARRLGITATLRPDPALALGVFEVSPLEMTAAYATLSSGGYAVSPFAIRTIRDRDGNTLYVNPAHRGPRVIDDKVVRAANNLFHASIKWGTSKNADPGRPAAGKTGTSQDYRDAWFIGYTPQLTATVWMGNDKGAATDGVTGGGYPALLWKEFVTRALKDEPPLPLPGTAALPTGGDGS